MTKAESLLNFIESRNGYLPVYEAQKMGVSRAYIQEYVNKNGFERVARGVYKSPDAWNDDLYILTLRNEKMVYAFDTALMLHGLTEREHSEIFATVPRAYNASHLRKSGVVVNYVRDEWMDLGRTVAKTTYGNEVSVYDMERTICDIIRVKNKKDPQMFVYAIKEYAKSPKKDLTRLMKYAKEFGVEEKLRQYMEVLL